MNIRKRIALICAVVFATAMGYATPAAAQATRTWVSGVGDDVNPCSRTAPCKTFAGAISKTAAGGEINCLDPGGFGAVTINKSLTISCPYTEGGALAGGNGITVNAGASDVVYLRGLDIFGVNPPTNGIRFIAGAALIVEDCVIRRFNAANSAGISFAPSAAGTRLYINNTTIADNGNGATGGGIVIKPGAAGSARVSLKNVRIVNNANVGLQIDGTGSAGTGIFVSVEGSSISDNLSNGVVALHPVGGQGLAVSIRDSVISSNFGIGILGNGTAATVRVRNSAIVHNVGLGVSRLNGSNVTSYGDNMVIDNTGGDGTFLAPNNTPL